MADDGEQIAPKTTSQEWLEMFNHRLGMGEFFMPQAERASALQDFGRSMYMCAICVHAPGVITELEALTPLYRSVVDEFREAALRTGLEQLGPGLRDSPPTGLELDKALRSNFDQEVFNAYLFLTGEMRDWWRESGRIAPAMTAIVEAIEFWGKKFNVTENWIIEPAVRCLHEAWRGYFSGCRFDHWFGYPGGTSGNPMGFSRHFFEFGRYAYQTPTREAISDRDIPPSMFGGCSQEEYDSWIAGRSEESIEAIYSEVSHGRDLVFRSEGWDPLTQHRAQFEARMKDQFAIAVKRYLDQIESELVDLGYERTPEKFAYHHFAMMVEWRVNRQSWQDIALKYCDELGRDYYSSSGAQRAVRRAENLIGVPAYRKPGGRPRKKKKL